MMSDVCSEEQLTAHIWVDEVCRWVCFWLPQCQFKRPPNLCRTFETNILDTSGHSFSINMILKTSLRYFSSITATLKSTKLEQTYTFKNQQKLPVKYHSILEYHQ